MVVPKESRSASFVLATRAQFVGPPASIVQLSAEDVSLSPQGASKADLPIHVDVLDGAR